MRRLSAELLGLPLAGLGVYFLWYYTGPAQGSGDSHCNARPPAVLLVGVLTLIGLEIGRMAHRDAKPLRSVVGLAFVGVAATTVLCTLAALWIYLGVHKCTE